MSKRVPCALGCGYLATVPDDWPKDQKAYCTQLHRDTAAYEAGMYAKGLELGHPPECPGCCGSGVEDNARWGGDLELCSWPQRDGKPVSGEEARDMARVRPELCACRDHIMHVRYQRGVWVEELDERGVKHGFESCPGVPCKLPPPGWRCTRGFHPEGPCAAVPVPPPARAPRGDKLGGPLLLAIAALFLASLFRHGCG